jgi:membrane fusion protein, multidrug efflux system
MNDSPNLAESLPVPPPAPKPNRGRRLILLIVVPLIAALVVLVMYFRGGRYVGTDNAYVESDKAPISAQVAGTIQDVLVRENEGVAAGQILFRLDPMPFQVAVAKAEANLAQTRANLLALKASYREKRYEIALARTRHAFALKDEERQAVLASKNYVPSTTLDASRLNVALTAQQISALEEDLERIAESLGGSAENPVEQHPSYRMAVAELDQARLDLTHVEVRAPLAGTVNKRPTPGQYLSAGDMAMVLVVNGNRWVEANLTEKDLTHVHPGQTVAIDVDTYPGVTWKGVVESLSPATGSEFSIIPAQNATGNWVKIAQRVAVRIRLEDSPELPPLRSGLSAAVKIDTGYRRHLPGFHV